MNKSPIVISVVSLVIGLIALIAVSVRGVPQSQVQNLGGTYDVQTTAPTFAAGEDIGPLPVFNNWQGGKVATSSKLNSASWKNTSGQLRYVDYVEVSTDGTASSTYKVYAYASTSAPSALYDFANNPSNVSGTIIAINAFTIGTSTTATTTTNIDKALNGRTVQVPDGSYLDILLKGADTGCASQGSGVCETATSTKRGFNLNWRIHYHN